MRRRFVALVLAVLAADRSSAPAQTVIRTYPDPGVGGGVLLNYGSTLPQAIQSQGQTFVAPSNALALTDYTFWIGSGPSSTGSPSSGFYAGVQQFDPISQNTIGPGLFRELRSPDPLTSGYVPYTFTTNDLSLQPGATYVAFLTPVQNGDPVYNGEPILYVNFRNDNPFAGGGAFFSTPSFAPTQWYAYPGRDAGGANLLLEARFTTIPEPTPLATVVTGMLLLLAVRRVRLRRTVGARGRAPGQLTNR